MTTTLHITVLVENTSPGEPLAAEAGLALWIETGGRRVLFDTGLGKALPVNAPALGVDLASADAVVLSHGHLDHTGSLAHVMDLAPGAVYYAHPGALEPKYSCRDKANPRQNGMPADCAARLRSGDYRFVETRGPTEIVPGLHVTGEVPRRTDYEDTGVTFYLDADARQPDPILDDQSLWAECPQGTVVLCGCAHSGVVNTMAYVAQHTGTDAMDAVIGGTHLMHASLERLEHTAQAFERFGVRVVAPCHCTGSVAQDFFRRRLPDRFVACTAGSRFALE